MSQVSLPGIRDRVPEAAAYGLLVVLGTALVATSFGYGLRTEDDWVGPGFLPLVVGGLLLVLSGAELVRCLRGSRPTDRHDPLLDRLAPVRSGGQEATTADGEEPTDIFGRTETQRVRQLWVVVAAMVVTVSLVPLLGLPVAFGGLVFFISAWVERRPVASAAIITAVSIAVIYLVFVILLGVPLPGGLIGVGV